MSTPESDISETIRAEIEGGHKIEAIQIIREFTGLDLKTAKEICDHCRANGCADLEEMLAGSQGEPATLTEEAGNAIDELLFAGKKIEAIKRLRKETGLGLKEAKDQIDERCVFLGKRHPDKMTRAGGGCGAAILLVIIGLSALFSCVV